MLVDARSLPPDARLDTDVCIVGAGPAGLTVARHLAGRGRRVLLLDSGGLRPDEESRSLSDGRVTGLDYFDLRDARCRGLGGSTGHWDIPLDDGRRGARLHPLSPLDFAARDWVPGSGWPFTAAHLDPYYAMAARLCAIEPAPPPAAGPGGDGPGPRPLPLDPTRVRTEVFRIGPADVWRPEKAFAGRRRGVSVLHHATVLEVVHEPPSRAVTGVRVAAAAGRSLPVSARVVVLACGGIENARLLLLSRPGRRGLGNGRGLVGRFFMEHPHLRAGLLVARRGGPRADLRLYGVHRTARAWAEARLTLAEPVVRELRLQACGVRLQALPDTGPACGAATLEVLAEQAPNFDSRVGLDRRRRDPLGQPQAVLDWRVTRRDLTSVVRSLRLMGREFEARGLGRWHVALDPEQPPAGMRGGRHHMGTTRMHPDPARGVVDADGRVHGLANLYVAGSSVFPTGGHANPTLTIVALAVRLAEHLGEQTATRR